MKNERLEYAYRSLQVNRRALPAMSRQRLYSSDQARDMARRRLPRIVFDYIDGAAGKESAATGNLAALDRLRL